MQEEDTREQITDNLYMYVYACICMCSCTYVDMYV